MFSPKLKIAVALLAISVTTACASNQASSPSANGATAAAQASADGATAAAQASADRIKLKVGGGGTITIEDGTVVSSDIIRNGAPVEKDGNVLNIKGTTRDYGGRMVLISFNEDSGVGSFQIKPGCNFNCNRPVTRE